jgi:hypothetical protein
MHSKHVDVGMWGRVARVVSITDAICRRVQLAGGPWLTTTHGSAHCAPSRAQTGACQHVHTP